MRIAYRGLFIAGAIALVFALVWIKYEYFDSYRTPNLKLGFSFDPQYAEYLGLDPKKTFDTIINDWKFKYLRLSVHWDVVEKDRGQFDFSLMDYYLGEAQKNGVKVLLAIGNKTPRWPECHFPEWSKSLAKNENRAELLNYLKTTVERYKNNPAVEIWQVENEPFLGPSAGGFGSCVKISPEELSEEIALVKSTDATHPVLVADSGELSNWQETSRVADYFGTTMYRVTWNKYTGYWSYGWLPAIYYRTKLARLDRSADTAFIVELQAEPWAPHNNLKDLSIEEQNKSMDLNRLKKNIEFANHVSVSRTYLWGAEWWVWLKEKGYNEIPDFISGLNH